MDSFWQPARRATVHSASGTWRHAHGAPEPCIPAPDESDHMHEHRTRLRCAVDGARILRWSPLGNYLLVAGQTACAVEIWETHSWYGRRLISSSHNSWLSSASLTPPSNLTGLPLAGQHPEAVFLTLLGPPTRRR